MARTLRTAQSEDETESRSDESAAPNTTRQTRASSPSLTVTAAA